MATAARFDGLWCSHLVLFITAQCGMLAVFFLLPWVTATHSPAAHLGDETKIHICETPPLQIAPPTVTVP